MPTPTSTAFVLGALLLECAPLARSGGDEAGAAAEMSQLEVAGHNPAVVSVPRDTGEPVPLLVATHGAWDRAEGAL